jgi:hypothetical protein
VLLAVELIEARKQSRSKPEKRNRYPSVLDSFEQWSPVSRHLKGREVIHAVANNRRTDSHQRCHALWRNSFVVAPTSPPKKMRTSSGVIVCSNPGSQVLS